MRDHPLHIVGTGGGCNHICPAGKCAQGQNKYPMGVSQVYGDDVAEKMPQGPAQKPSRGSSGPPDPGHAPTQAEREEFWASEPIHIHPEGTQE